MRPAPERDESLSHPYLSLPLEPQTLCLSSSWPRNGRVEARNPRAACQPSSQARWNAVEGISPPSPLCLSRQQGIEEQSPAIHARESLATSSFD
ncbi:hypothetical protein BaRGS_00007936 [Batillaria attramentaria]|uniref:Uncharacterized protein n=1 Tax=Batillaria attramentaria TaxID=370345 RepID=A0ABD0LMY2_9CAEN